jgi:hypothetical protein
MDVDGDASARRSRGPRRARPKLATALLVVGVVFLNLSAVSLWTWRTFASSQGFADAATDMLKEPAVQQVLAEQIVNQIVQQTGVAGDNAIAFRPALESVVAQVVGSEAFAGVFHSGVRQLHAAVVQGLRTSLQVNVDDALVLVKKALAVAQPNLAQSIPPGALKVLVGISQSGSLSVLMTVADFAGVVAVPFVVLAVLCFVFAYRVAAIPRRMLELIGLSMVVSGIGLFAVLFAGVNLAAGFGGDPRARTALRAVFWSATHVLNIVSKVFLTTGAVLWVSAANVGPGDVKRRAQQIHDFIVGLVRHPGWRFLGCIALAAASLFAMSFPAAAAAVLVRVLAFGVFVVSAVGILNLLGAATTERTAAEAPDIPRKLAKGMATVMVVALSFFIGGVAIARAAQPAGAASPSPGKSGCNGHVELCDKHLDEVVWPATHNSMSAGPGWYVANQTYGILAQLADGIRGLLIDLHYGAFNGTIVRTDVQAEISPDKLAKLTPDEQAALFDALSAGGLAVPADKRRVYLCHLRCEQGATLAESELRQVNDYLRERPNEVVVIIVESFVSPADAVKTFERSGLAKRAYVWQPGTRGPTLRELIEKRKNVVVMAETGGGVTPWYLPAFDGFLQETPYDFASIAEMSCAAHRGGRNGSLFLLNHWISTEGIRSVAAAAEANSRKVLLARAQKCAEDRQKPNLIAVDFYDRGDLFAVVDELNGVATIEPITAASVPRRVPD